MNDMIKFASAISDYDSEFERALALLSHDDLQSLMVKEALPGMGLVRGMAGQAITGIGKAGLGARVGGGAALGAAAGAMRDPGYDPSTGQPRSRIGNMVGGALTGGIAGAAAKPAIQTARSWKGMTGIQGSIGNAVTRAEKGGAALARANERQLGVANKIIGRPPAPAAASTPVAAPAPAPVAHAPAASAPAASAPAAPAPAAKPAATAPQIDAAAAKQQAARKLEQSQYAYSDPQKALDKLRGKEYGGFAMAPSSKVEYTGPARPGSGAAPAPVPAGKFNPAAEHLRAAMESRAKRMAAQPSNVIPMARAA